MRQSVSVNVRNVLRSARTEASATRWTPQPYVCASCLARGTTSTSRSLPRSQRTRLLSSSTLRRQQATPSASPASQKESVLPQTHYDFFPLTFPNGPPPASSFAVDLKQLRKEFLQLQAKAHPDLAPQDRKRQAEALSMRINEAYKTLQDPLKRAQYLLRLQNIDVEDESAQLNDNALLMEVMEAREAVEEVEDEEDLVELKASNQTRVEESERILEETFKHGDMESAANEAVRLRYWKNIEESIQGWEKGKGGGMIHH